MKWNTPFFIEPRFLFASAGFKAHLWISPGEGTMEHLLDKVAQHKTTKHMTKIRYNQEINKDPALEMAKYCAQVLNEREDDSFW